MQGLLDNLAKERVRKIKSLVDSGRYKSQPLRDAASLENLISDEIEWEKKLRYDNEEE